DNTNAVNVLISISPIYNRIVIDLSHTDDNENNTFINGALSFGPIISMNYSSNDYSLPLKSTSNQSSFSMINTRNTTQQFLLTSARCIPEGQNPQEIFYSLWHPPFSEQLAFYYFGRVFLTQRNVVDFALIEKLEETFKLSPMVRTSIQEYPLVPISSIDLDTLLPVGHHICKSGYGTHSWCGRIYATNSDFFIRPVNNVQKRFRDIIKAHIYTLENDIG
ncbi:4761_t:CDS:2, partial [Gigaspora margarita]